MKIFSSHVQSMTAAGRHCMRSEAIQSCSAGRAAFSTDHQQIPHILDCFAALAMTIAISFELRPDSRIHPVDSFPAT
jgi:hypothetical protein